MWIEKTVVEKMFGGLLMVEWKVGAGVLKAQAADTSLEILEIGPNPLPESIPSIPIELSGAAEGACEAAGGAATARFKDGRPRAGTLPSCQAQVHP